MCAICGYIDPARPAGELARTVTAMARAQAHRGPDDEGSWATAGVALGHRRLSVIDLTTGHQPIASDDGRYQIVYNGEVYNYRELGAWLETRGHRLRTSSDTEVVLRLYQELGDDCLERLNGMFAFAIWDDQAQELFAARDRMGQKPFYYAALRGGAFVFASEMKGVLACPAVARDIDPLAVAKYLAYEYVPTPRTIFRGVHRLPAGCSLRRRRDGGLSIRRYWDLSFRGPERGDENAWAQTLRELVDGSVQRRLVADVPLGVFLSGGIDSSSLVASMAARLPGKEIKTFSIGFAEPSFDESPFAERVAAHYGSDHRQRTLSADGMVAILPQVLDTLDEPFSDPSIMPTYLLSQFTREHVTVALGGDGGDELFAGYDPFVAHRLTAPFAWLPPAFWRRVVQPLADALPVSYDNQSFDFRIKQLVRGLGHPAAVRNQIWLGAFSPPDLARLLADPTPAALAPESLYSESLDLFAACDGRTTIDRLLYVYARTYLQDDILVKVDRASMASSLEVRAPYLDPELVDFACSLPASVKLRGLTRKYLLKKALRDAVPADIRNRNKKGFGIPVARWIRQDLRDLFRDTLAPARIARSGLFAPAEVSALLDNHLTGRRDQRKQLWALFMFEQWYERYAKPGAASEAT